MKIDFGSRYREVSKLLRASAAAQPAPQAAAPFEADLKSLLPQSPPKTQDISAESLALRPHVEAYARFNFDSLPTLERPVAPPAVVPPAPGPAPEVASPRVKTPTVLSVKRISFDATDPTIPTADPQRVAIQQQLQSASDKFGVDPTLAAAVVQAESAFNPHAVSADGHASKGLFQLLDSTGKELLARSADGARRYNPFDPQLNIELGTSYLRYLHDIFSESTPLSSTHRTVAVTDPTSRERFAIAAFNAGEGRVASAQQRAERAGKDPAEYAHVAEYLPSSTRLYVTRVLENRKALG
jgi:soluble lytic murein transglycosylase-like protein